MGGWVGGCGVGGWVGGCMSVCMYICIYIYIYIYLRVTGLTAAVQAVGSAARRQYFYLCTSKASKLSSKLMCTCDDFRQQRGPNRKPSVFVPLIVFDLSICQYLYSVFDLLSLVYACMCTLACDHLSVFVLFVLVKQVN